MWKYYLLQFKRLLRTFPYIFMTIFVLFTCLIIAFGAALKSAEGEGTIRFRLALVSTDDDEFFQAGLEIAQGYDSSRFAIETLHLDEAEAKTRLERGELDAYVVIPAGYIQNAINGELGSLKYVSTPGTADLTTLFKDEITAVVSDIIITCEKGMYAVDQIAEEYDFNDRSGKLRNQISLQYVNYVIDRSDFYYVDELGIHDSLGFDGYLFAGITVLILTVMLIPAGVCYIKHDIAVEQLLKTKNIGPVKQVLGEYLALLTAFTIPVLLVCAVSTILMPTVPETLARLLQMLTLKNFFVMFSVLFALAAFGYLLFQLANELVGGVLLYFFTGLALCFVAGCMYPVYFFPEVIRSISGYVPQGLCRILLAGEISGEPSQSSMWFLWGYSISLLVFAYLLRLTRLRAPKR